MDTETQVGTTLGKSDEEALRWFAMCDRKRRNAIDPAYKMLQGLGFEVFTPMVRKARRIGDKKEVVEMPFIADLLFVHSTMKRLDPIESVTPTLHYRFVKGGGYREPVVVPESDMARFIRAVGSMETKEYFFIDDLPREKIGSEVIVHGGPLDGYQVLLKKMQGSKKKRVYVELPRFLAAEIELTYFDSLEELKGR